MSSSKTWSATSPNTQGNRSGLAAAGRALWRRLCALHRNGKERHQLMGLTDYQLRDVGLCRSDIEIELSKPLWRD